MVSIGIVGRRDGKFNEEKVKRIFNRVNDKEIRVVSGGAIGIDSAAEQFARKYQYQTLIFKPDYQRFGYIAPLIRNTDIIKNSNLVIAFWDYKRQGGTWDSIKKAKRYNKDLYIIKI